MNAYKLGQSVRFTATCTDPGGNLTDPPSLACTVKSFGGTVYSGLTVTRDSQGKYHADFAIPTGEQPGTWYARWQATGGAPASNALVEEAFIVQPLDF